MKNKKNKNIIKKFRNFVAKYNNLINKPVVIENKKKKYTRKNKIKDIYDSF